MPKRIGYTFVDRSLDIFNYDNIDYESCLEPYLKQQHVHVYKTLVETYTEILKYQSKFGKNLFDHLKFVKDFYKKLIEKEGKTWRGVWKIMRHVDIETDTLIKCVFAAEPIPDNQKVAYMFIFEEHGDNDILEEQFMSEVIVYPTLRGAYNGFIKYIKNNNIPPYLRHDTPTWIENIDAEIDIREGTTFKTNFEIGSYENKHFIIYLKCVFLSD